VKTQVASASALRMSAQRERRTMRSELFALIAFFMAVVLQDLVSVLGWFDRI
jgi:hypothetical protein